MERVSVEDAFAGRPPSSQGGFEAGADHEAAILAVRGGEVVAVIPTGTAEDEVVGRAALIRGALRLENERVLSFEIRPGASGASYDDEPAQLHLDRRRRAAASAPTRTDRMVEAGTAEAIMTRDVLTASPDELVEDVAKLLVFHNISGMPVIDWDGKVVGIVSEVDVIGKLGTTVGDVMTSDVISVSPSTPLEQIAALMAERRIKRVPVIDNSALVGIVSRADIVRALAARLGLPLDAS